MPKRMYIFIIFIILQCLNYDVQFLILFGVYYDCTNKSFKCYVIQLLLCIKGSTIVYHAKFSLISNEIANFIRFNIDALQFFQVKASVTWFSIAMNWKVIIAFSNVHWRDTSFLNNLLTPWIILVQLNYSAATHYNSVATHYNYVVTLLQHYVVTVLSPSNFVLLLTITLLQLAITLLQHFL